MTGIQAYIEADDMPKVHKFLVSAYISDRYFVSMMHYRSNKSFNTETLNYIISDIAKDQNVCTDRVIIIAISDLGIVDKSDIESDLNQLYDK